MRHKKKVSDFMIDSKIPVNLKSRVLVLCSGEAIAWVVGHRIDNRFKVTDNTRSILKVTVDEND
jgi:tRNA(Ile)-lysidine synthase